MSPQMFAAPLKVAALMRGFAPAWGFAGGWAIDLFLNRETRAHADIEIAVLRRDQTALQNHLRRGGWRLQKVSGGELSEWRENEILELPIHEIHCFNERAEPSFLEVLFNEADDAEWIFRRDARVCKPLTGLFATRADRLDFLRPEIVLLYKSKNPRPKDEQDFEAAVEHLDAVSRNWLKNAVSIVDKSHQWLDKL